VNIQANVDDLMLIVGAQQVEIFYLRKKVAELSKALEEQPKQADKNAFNS
jgi:hypothetical protein